MGKPTVLTGAFIGALLAAPLAALSFLGAQLAGLPFIAFDLFDWIARLLPGPVITFGIDLIVNTISAFNLGPTSSTAKTAEQIMAVGMLLGAGALLGAVFFALWNARSGQERPSGIALGAGLGVVAMLISAGVNRSASAAPIFSAVWLVVLFAGWGAALDMVYARLASAKATPMTGSGELGRREFLVRVGGASAVLTFAGASLGSAFGSRAVSDGTEAVEEAAAMASPVELPNSDDALVPAPGTRPEYTPLAEHYRIDINTLPPVVDEETWTLPITGLVDTPLNLTLAEIRANYTPVEQFVTLACISNRVGGDLTSTTLWTGARLKDILADAGLQSTATHLKITAADGFDETVAIETVNTDERVMLAYEWDRQPLTVDHGFPLRIYIPNLFGMKQPKWITGIEVLDHDEEGYWVRRGWSKEARMKATSVIDTVATSAIVGEGDSRLVPIGGIAHAGARGISRVEIRVDDGEWVEAQLRSPLSETTWVIWRYDWPFAEGRHDFFVRCFEADGTVQETEIQSPRPDGATGIDMVTTEV